LKEKIWPIVGEGIAGQASQKDHRKAKAVGFSDFTPKPSIRLGRQNRHRDTL